MEQEIIQKIKEVAVKSINELIHMCEFFRMDQREGETSRQYCARLKEAAKLCDFTAGSGENMISYADQMIIG